MARQRTGGIDDLLDMPYYSDVAANVRPAAETAAKATESVTPWGAILGGAGSILDAITTWYAVGEQRKENTKTREQQDAWFQQNMGFEREKLDVTTGLTREAMAESRRQARVAERMGGRTQRLQERTARTSAGLAKRGMAVSEAESAAGIELGRSADVRAGEAQAADIKFRERDIALQEKTVKFNQVATVLSNMTRFFNSPQNNAQFVSLWRKAA